MEFTIAPMRMSDLDEVMVIERYSFPTPWERSAYEYDVRSNQHARFYTARDAAGALAGYIGSWFIIDECHVGTIATAREFRRRGVARALLSHTAAQGLTEGMKYVILEVRETNAAAISLYEGLGFRIVGRRKGYYKDTGEDAHLMYTDDLNRLLGAHPAASSPPVQ
ncbi:MAG: ribosomal protein S18-alanine N-acetyltransferase [bacterium]